MGKGVLHSYNPPFFPADMGHALQMELLTSALASTVPTIPLVQQTYAITLLVPIGHPL